MLAARTFKDVPITARLVRFNERQPHVRVANFATRTRGRIQMKLVWTPASQPS